VAIFFEAMQQLWPDAPDDAINDCYLKMVSL